MPYNALSMMQAGVPPGLTPADLALLKQQQQQQQQLEAGPSTGGSGSGGKYDPYASFGSFDFTKVAPNLNPDTAAAEHQKQNLSNANAESVGGVPGTIAGAAAAGTNILGGLFTGSAGTALLGDAVGGLGTMLGGKLMGALSGGGSAQAASQTADAAKAFETMSNVIANNKSSMLQNTNAMGQQGTAAAIEAQQRMNSQMVSGDAVADKNRILGTGNTAQSNAMGMAKMGMQQNQMSQQNNASSIMNMRGGSGVANLGALQSMNQQNAQNNLGALQAGGGLMSSANQQALQSTGAASDVFGKDLASNFTRNVAPSLNQWENFQQTQAQVAGGAAAAAGGTSNATDNQSYNLFGGTATMLGARSGMQNVGEQTTQWTNPLTVAKNIAAGIIH